MKTKNLGLLVAAWLAGSLASEATAMTLPDPAPVTTNVAVSDATVTATITPYSGGTENIDQAEFFVDAVGSDGSGTPMSLTADASRTATATGTLPTLPLNSDHTVYVHGHDDFIYGGERWGELASTTFTVTSTTVTTPLGGAVISYLDFGTKYVVDFLPQEPCAPTDPCRVRSRFGRWNAADTLGYSRIAFNVPDGVVSLFTKVTPTDSCYPTDPCRKRDVLIGFVASNGLKYTATTEELDTTYLAK